MLRLTWQMPLSVPHRGKKNFFYIPRCKCVRAQMAVLHFIRTIDLHLEWVCLSLSNLFCIHVQTWVNFTAMKKENKLIDILGKGDHRHFKTLNPPLIPIPERAEGVERGNGPEHPRQGASKKWNFQNCNAVIRVFFCIARLPKHAAWIQFCETYFLSTLQWVLRISNVYIFHIPQY